MLSLQHGPFSLPGLEALRHSAEKLGHGKAQQRLVAEDWEVRTTYVILQFQGLR